MSGLLMAAPLSGLPESFIASLKSLFNIVSGNSSVIKLTDLEKRFKQENNNLPNDVIIALRSLSLNNGDISFDIFLTAIRIASSTKINSPDIITRKVNTDTIEIPISNFVSKDIEVDENNSNKKIFNRENNEKNNKSNNTLNIINLTKYGQPFVINPPISPIPKYDNKIHRKNKKSLFSNTIANHAYSMPDLYQQTLAALFYVRFIIIN